MRQKAKKKTGTGSLGNYRADRDRFAAFALSAADLLIETDGEQRIAYVAGAARAITGRDARELVGSGFSELFAPSHRSFARSLLRRVRRAQRLEPVRADFDRGGASVNVVLRGCCLPERPGSCYFTVSYVAEMPAEDIAQRDEDTGLLTGAAFEKAATAALKDGAGSKLTLTVIDVAGIDALRGKAGDGAAADLLGEIGSFLAANATEGAGRIASDRFAVLQEGAKTLEIERGIERISRACDGTLSVKGQAVSLGAAGLTPADAEKALAYTLGCLAAGGGATIRSLADGFQEMVVATAGRMSQVRRSMDDDHLSIVFQPVVALADRQLHHYEVLTRFEQERSPAELVKFAESVGMIEELDLSVCQRALAVLEEWRESAELRLAVNVSGRSLSSDAFVAALETMLKPRSDRSRLLFEITETTEIKDLSRAERVVQEFRKAGHKVCLDDFGAGAASFPYLQALTVDFVKIDGAYVNRMLETLRDHAILKAMVGLCGEIGIATIAEMIETDAQAQRLAQLGVGFGQGYLFGRPAPTPTAQPEAARKVLPKTVVFARRKGYMDTWG